MKDWKRILIIFSIGAVFTILLSLLLTGYDLSGIRIEKGFHLG